jgi:hypothetical protein
MDIVGQGVWVGGLEASVLKRLPAVVACVGQDTPLQHPLAVYEQLLAQVTKGAAV